MKHTAVISRQRIENAVILKMLETGSVSATLRVRVERYGRWGIKVLVARAKVKPEVLETEEGQADVKRILCRRLAGILRSKMHWYTSMRPIRRSANDSQDNYRGVSKQRTR